MLISDKTDLKLKNLKSDKERHYIMIKGSIQEEHITILNIYAHNIGVSTSVHKANTNRYKRGNCNTIILGDF